MYLLVVQATDSADLTRDLMAWLAEEPGLRGRVDVVECPPPPHTLGPVVSALEAVLEPGGAATALASVIITWLRHRTSKVSLSISGRNGHPSLIVTAERVKNLDSESLHSLVTHISEELRVDTPGPNALKGNGHDGA
jgi:hypothetical protein